MAKQTRIESIMKLLIMYYRISFKHSFKLFIVKIMNNCIRWKKTIWKWKYWIFRNLLKVKILCLGMLLLWTLLCTILWKIYWSSWKIWKRIWSNMISCWSILVVLKMIQRLKDLWVKIKMFLLFFITKLKFQNNYSINYIFIIQLYYLFFGESIIYFW